MGWGHSGHVRINTCTSLSFNQQMSQFMVWTSILAEHASDADYRKDTDPTEAPKHYIDIDNYDEFITTGRIPQTYDSVVALYGEDFVIDQGILPWATLITFDSLKSCFQRLDWNKAVIFAADLGHYIADGYMPLHICKNYDGQYTGNDGIHSRYESTMINGHITEINYSGEDIALISDVRQYVFNYLYTNFTYADSVIAADNYAKTISGNTSSTAYKQALWEKSQGFTIPLFKNASHSLAELIYTAWVEAGSPLISPSFIVDPAYNPIAHLGQNTPNPFSSSTNIEFTLRENSIVHMEVRDLSGKTVELLSDKYYSAGNYSITWNPRENIRGGIYYLVLNTGKYFEVKKIVLLK